MKKLHAKLWRPGYGSISASEADFLATEIEREKPQSFVEIGTATGLSAVMIATVLRRAGAGKLTTIDHSSSFYGDQSKQTGFLIDEHFGDEALDIRRLTGLTSVDLEGNIDASVSMAFIDANHGHPWPVLDTLLVWPFLAKDALLFHHDLRLYQKTAEANSRGPKYVFDHMPEQHRKVVDDRDRNMFWVRKAFDEKQLAARLADAILLPWEPVGKIGFRLARKITDRLAEHYPPFLEQAFVVAFDRFNGKL